MVDMPQKLIKRSEDTRCPVYLMHVDSLTQAGMVEALLGNAGIPVMRRFTEVGLYLQIIHGFCAYGLQLYVPRDALEQARELCEAYFAPAPVEQAEWTSRRILILSMLLVPVPFGAL